MSSGYDIAPPPDDRPARNGLDYTRYRGSGSAKRFTPDATDVSSWVGATPAYVASRPERVRAARTGTFSAIGPLARDLIVEGPEDVYGPLRELAKRGGSVVLIGVGL